MFKWDYYLENFGKDLGYELEMSVWQKIIALLINSTDI